MSGEDAHSIRSPSSSKMWTECPGAVRFGCTCGSPPTKYSIEGSNAHKLLEYCVKNMVADATDFVDCDAPFADGWTVSKEMADAVNVMLRHLWADLEPDDELYAERKLRAPAWIDPEGFGTVDVTILRPKKRRAKLKDYKHGVGVAVPVADSTQLKQYAVMVVAEAEARGIEIDEVEITIVQPRCPTVGEAVQSITLTALDLIAYSAEWAAAVQATHDPNAPRIPGDHCQFAAKAAVCPDLREHAMRAATDAFGEIIDPVQVDGLSDEELARRWRQLPLLKLYMKALDKHVHSVALEKPLPGIKWVYGRQGARKWKDDAQTSMVQVFALTGQDVSEVAMPSPAKLEKMLSPDAFGMLSELFVRSAPPVWLTHEEARGKALDLSEVKSSATAGFDVIDD